MRRRPALLVALALTLLAGCGDTQQPVTTVGSERALSELRPVRAVLDTTTTTLPPSTTTTHPPSTTSTAPPPTTTSTTLSTQPPPPTGEGCAGWADTIAAHFPPEQRSKACSVMLCETGGTGDPTAQNPSSSASGLWQFLDSTWRSTTGLAPPASAYSGDRQTAAAAALWRSSGWSPWSCA